MSLELRYLRLLRWYPGAYRARRGAEMLATMLDAADASGRTAPGRRERVDVACRGIQVRLGLTPDHLTGDVLVIAAPVAIGVAFALAAAGLLLGETGPHFHGSRYFGPFTSTGVVIYSFAALSGVLQLLGHARAARRASLVCALACLIALPLGHLRSSPRPPLYFLALVAGLSTITALAPVPHWRVNHGRRALTAVSATAAGIYLVVPWVHRPIDDPGRGFMYYRGPSGPLSERGPLSWIVLAVVVVVFAISLRLGRPRTILATAILALPVLGIPMIGSAGMAGPRDNIMLGALREQRQALATAAVIVVLGCLATRLDRTSRSRRTAAGGSDSGGAR